MSRVGSPAKNTESLRRNASSWRAVKVNSWLTRTSRPRKNPSATTSVAASPSPRCHTAFSGTASPAASSVVSTWSSAPRVSGGGSHVGPAGRTRSPCWTSARSTASESNAGSNIVASTMPLRLLLRSPFMMP